MKLINYEPLANKKIWSSLLKGRFFNKEDEVFFLFRNDYKELALYELENGIIKSKNYYFIGNLPLSPLKWSIYNDTMVVIGDNTYVDLAQKTMVENAEIDIKINRKYDYYFDDYYVFYNEKSKYTCKKNNKKIWDFKSQGYLYTDIIKYKDKLLFGTDGWGGHFYIVNLENGIVEYDLDTGGTNEFIVNNECAYILDRKKNTIIVISLYNYKIVDETMLPERTVFESSLGINADILYVTTYKENKNTNIGEGYLSTYKI